MEEVTQTDRGGMLSVPGCRPVKIQRYDSVKVHKGSKDERLIRDAAAR